jgi:hypothetical protein
MNKFSSSVIFSQLFPIKKEGHVCGDLVATWGLILSFFFSFRIILLCRVGDKGKGTML